MFHNEELDAMIGFYGSDYLGLAEEVKNRIARGDFNNLWSRLLARRLMRTAVKEHWLAQLNTPQQLAQRQTRAAERSAQAACIAIVVSVFALAISVLAYIKTPESPASNKADSPTRSSLSLGNEPRKPASAIAPR